jgi:hypothetical protein
MSSTASLSVLWLTQYLSSSIRQGKPDPRI